MTTITYAQFQANMHHYLERVFRDKAIIKVKDGQRTFVLLGESLPAVNSDNIARFGELKFKRPNQPTTQFRRFPRAPFATR
jgi:hypothetical protein